MREQHDLPLIAAIAGAIRWLEELISLLSGPLLSVGLAIALIDLLTGGGLLRAMPELLFAWGICQAVGIDAQLVATWDRCRMAMRSGKWGQVFALALLGVALGYVGFLSAEAFGFQQAFGLSEAEALQRLGIDAASWQLQRALLAVFLVALSGFTRYHPQKASVANERERLQRELELEPMRQQARAMKATGMAALARSTLVAAKGASLEPQPPTGPGTRERAAQAEGARRLRAMRTCTQCGALAQSARHLIRPAGDDPASPRLCTRCYEAWEYAAGLRALYHEARELLDRAAAPGGRPLRVLDTETTGLGEQDEPIELAIVDGLNGAVLLDTRLRPLAPISPGAYAIHGISASELQDAPALADIWSRVCELLSGALVIAYNADFDRQVLAQAAQRYGLRLPKCRWYCLMEACSVFDAPVDGRWLSLNAVCAELEVQGAPAHSARADALSALAVVQALAARATV
jgi:Exonuclease